MTMFSICLDQHKNIFSREIVLVPAAIWWRIDSQTHESELLLAFCCLRWNTSPNTHSVLYHVWQVNLRVLSIQSEFCEIICLFCFCCAFYSYPIVFNQLHVSACLFPPVTLTYFLRILQLFLPSSLASCISFLFFPMHCFTGVPRPSSGPSHPSCHTLSPNEPWGSWMHLPLKEEYSAPWHF